MSSRARARLAAATSSNVQEELNPQNYGMDAGADVTDGEQSVENAHEGAEP